MLLRNHLQSRCLTFIRLGHCQYIQNSCLETAHDHILSKVLRYILNEWPTSVEANIQPYFICRNEITVEAGCLMWGIKVIVPVKLQRWVIKELHTGPPGIGKMKSLARIHVGWLGINQNIEELAKNCPSCQQFRNRPPPTTLHPWTWPVRSWHRVHIDCAGPFLGRYFLDAHSKWPEVVPMNSTTTEKTITELRKIFSTHGLPEQLFSDNGTQFTSEEFGRFLKSNGIKHIRSTAYHPAKNEEAELFVQTFKHALKTSASDDGSLEKKLARFLLTYRVHLRVHLIRQQMFHQQNCYFTAEFILDWIFFLLIYSLMSQTNRPGRNIIMIRKQRQVGRAESSKIRRAKRGQKF